MAEYTLYDYFRSSCAARVRIALNLKSIPYASIPVHLLNNEQLSPSHTALNPSSSVPLLIVRTPDSPDVLIGQSLAALEYLDETHPENPLLPPSSDLAARAAARSLAQIVACDVQPVTNLRIMRRVRELGGSAEEWNKELIARGLRAYEAVAEKWAGECSVGHQVTIADVCLVPTCWSAVRFGVDMGEFPVVSGIVERLSGHPAFVRAHWRNQADTPDEFRQA